MHGHEFCVIILCHQHKGGRADLRQAPQPGPPRPTPNGLAQDFPAGRPGLRQPAALWLYLQ
jgi:hypothetical protein